MYNDDEQLVQVDPPAMAPPPQVQAAQAMQAAQRQQQLQQQRPQGALPGMPAGFTTPEQRAHFYQNMPDVTGEQQHIARQRVLADQLRERALPTKKMDWASQAARALSGVGAGMREKGAMDDRKALFENIRKTYANDPANRMQAGGGGGGGDDYWMSNWGIQG